MNVLVEITDKGAVYVNESRITNRNTKWGNHKIISSFHSDMGSVVSKIVEHGYSHVLSNIDTEPYLSQIPS